MTEEHQGTFAKPKPKRQETRKRSPKACLSCRARKVRCDVTFMPSACTNCVLDSKQCVVSWRRRHNDRNHNKKPDVSKVETVAKPLPASKEDKDLLAVLTDEYLGTPKLAEPLTRQSPSYNHSQARPEITFAYYPFLCINNLSSLHTDDINYLDSQGCFKLPESSCLDHLVRAFFHHAHPILPVVNEAEFWSIYDPLTSGGKTSRVPVILLSAMLFVACEYVDGDVLQSMQHSTAHEARDSFLRKTQLLYDQETESSPVVLAQVSLLLAHWTSQKSSRTNRPSTQWLGRAIHHSQDAIYQAKVSTSVKSHFSQGNLRRLWGCCILSDCIHSLYTRRPLMMPPGMVEAERDCLVLSRADLSHEIGRSRVYGVEAKQRFIEAQEQMSALISILRRVLALVYPQGGMATCRTASTLGGEGYESRDCKNHLKTWYNDSLILLISGRDSALGSPVSLDDGTEHRGSQHDPIELLVSMMHLHYETAMLVLCQSELLHLTANPRATYSSYMLHEQVSFRNQKDDLANCILNLTDRLSESLRQQHLSRVPPIMIFCTALPLLVHLLNTKGHLYNGPSSPNVSSPSLSLQDAGVQCSRNPNWARRIIKCLGLHFRDELEYILQAVKAVNNSLTESLQESQESPILFAQEEEMQIGNWRELLDTRPRLYVRLIKRLDNVISWGGPLPETDMVAPFNEYQIPPGSSMTRQFQAEKPSLKWTPPVSSASARRNIKQRTPSMSYGDEPAAQLEVGETDSGCLHPEGLRESFSDILMQKLDLPQSCLDEAPGEAYSPTSLDPSRRIWAEKIAGSDRRVLDQVASREEIKPTAIDFTDADDMILVDGLSDEWIDALLQSDSAG
ncbi:hypothetical protein AU210_003660 [Fusarium oxysporum f. sp. radicis-cucumerinum]|uniref:Zn(2)-C6 fungal-type domain-containing protein n=1 Tax=Fusarium oxysporum f. sp. radicis-cucumerinum TaxID=327505 RepID=A0A2H3HUL3_FUSOX|nr:hypothetical protein AU210_003660 [Fusarium oxysporum f. sp. radicis-cucumerinum]